MQNGIQAQLNHELVRSEVLRNKAVLIMLLFGYITGIIGTVVTPIEWLASLFQNPRSVFFLAGMAFALIVVEAYVFFVFRQVAQKKKPFPHIRRHIQSVVELLYPAVLIGGLCFLEDSPSYLDAPPFYLYYLFLVLSILNLDFYLSLIAGITACFSYLGVSYWIIHTVTTSEVANMNLHPIFHAEKALFMLICGVIIAFIAKDIRRRISNSFEMEEERNQVKMLFGQQVSPQVMDELLADSAKKGSKRLEVTVMFMDIRNFTPFASTRTPEEIISFQNAIFSPIIEIIHKHGGIINQILGDGFMATFGAPISIKEHSEEALIASLEIVDTIKKIVAAGTIPKTRIGIGLHTGAVVAGNIGNHIRQQYSITGTTVITAARLEQLNKEYDSQIVLSEKTYQKVPELQKYFESKGDVLLKGQDNPVEIFVLKE